MVRFLIVLLSVFVAAMDADATPLIALREADNCAACHKPGRSQKPFLWRRCTLDCQGCHIDPVGGGARNEWGRYYTYAQLNVHWQGQPVDPLKAQSFFDVHYEGRYVRRRAEERWRSFPMASVMTLRLKPLSFVHLIYKVTLLGRIGDESLRYGQELRRRRDEPMVLIDQLPLNTFVRAGRGLPSYGLHRPNHSQWIREKLGFNPFTSFDLVEVGLTPNVPFLRVSYLFGEADLEDGKRQKGYSLHGGLRGVTQGWHIHGSYWQTENNDVTVEMSSIGGGFKVLNAAFSGERNFRQVARKDSSSNIRLNVHPSSVIDEASLSFSLARGINLSLLTEHMVLEEDRRLRRSIKLDYHPIPFMHFEIWRRFENGARTVWDTVAVAHAYWHF